MRRLGEILVTVQTTALAGREIRRGERWRTIQAARDGFRAVILTLDGGQEVTLSLWHLVEIRDPLVVGGEEVDRPGGLD